MTATPPTPTTRPRGFQFTLATLLSAMLWTALVAWALARPTDLAYSVLFLAMLVMMFTSVVATLYCRERRRAFAVGFLVFSFGHWACIWLILKAGNPNDYWTPASGITETFRGQLHPRGAVVAFYAIVNFTLTMLLGFVGGVIATLLYTEPPQPSGGATPNRTTP